MDIDTLIAEVGAQAIARFRRPTMDRAAAERWLVEQAASRDRPANPAQYAPRPLTTDDDPPPLLLDEPAAVDESADRSGRARELKAVARRVTGGQRPVRRSRPKVRDTVDHTPDPFLDQARSMGGGRPKAPARSALLRPPSRPLPRISVTSAPPAPDPPASPTRAAMGALFEDADSTEGLVFLGDEPDEGGGFERAGTDPTMAPLPGDDGAVDSIERTAESLDPPRPPERGTTLPDLRPQMPEIDPPTRGVTLTDHGRPDPALQLAGAEEPMPMDVPAAPFGFGPADAEPTRVERRAEPAPERSAPERHAPAHLSEEVVVSSVRKLFRR